MSPWLVDQDDDEADNHQDEETYAFPTARSSLVSFRNNEFLDRSLYVLVGLLDVVFDTIQDRPLLHDEI
jgi:hypothetical protein